MKEKIIKEIRKSNFTSTTFDGETQNKTASLLSSGVVIKSGDTPVGAIQNFSYHENELEDGKIGVSGTCSRIFFDKLSIVEAFTGKYDLDKKVKININICYLDRVTTLEDARLTNHHISFQVDTFVVVEEVSFTAKKVVTKKV